MKFCFYTALLTNIFLTPAIAAELAANSKIDSVIVYPRGAEITRLVQLNVAEGDHTLKINDLPGNVDAQTVRLESTEGNEISVQSVNSNVVLNDLPTNLNDRQKELVLQSQKLEDKLFLLEQQIENIVFRRKLIRDTAQRPLTIPAANPDETKQVTERDLGVLFDLVENRLNAVDKEELATKQAIRLIEKAILEIKFEMRQLSPPQKSQLVVAADIHSPVDQLATFKISYRIQNAGWQPFYDARLIEDQNEANANLTLVRHASIVQDTNEKWDGVSLTLATSLPSGSMVAPQIEPLETENFSEKGSYIRKSGRSSSKLSEAAPADSAAETAEAGNEIRFNDFIEIKGRLTVKNDGVSKKIQIADQTVPAKVVSRAVPIFDLNVYRIAKFQPVGNSPLLPGRVRLFRGNLYVGESMLPMLVPGQKYDLGFGVDARVQVTRNVVKKSTREVGIISTQNVDERSWITTVQNLHANPVNVEIFDRIPYSTVEGEEISVLSGTTPVTKKNVDNKRGVVLWERKIEPAKTDTIRFGYQMVIPR